MQRRTDIQTSGFFPSPRCDSAYSAQPSLAANEVVAIPIMGGLHH
jgi:hypothetical protein